MQKTILRKRRGKIQLRRGKSPIVARPGDRRRGAKYEFDADMATAARYGDAEFYVQSNFDKRGRVYGIPRFNFGREDHIRCLFDFAKGKKIGVGGLRWLKVHVCNLSAGLGSSQPSTMTFDERVAWVEDNRQALYAIAQAALAGHVDELFELLGQSKKPFQLTRACIELFRAGDNPEFISCLPLLFDASSSGLQHYCLLMRDKQGGRQVNLVPGVDPQDFYRSVAERLSDPNLVVGWQEIRPGVKTAIHIDARIHMYLVMYPNQRGVSKKVLVARIYGGEDIRKTLLREDWFKQTKAVLLGASAFPAIEA